MALPIMTVPAAALNIAVPLELFRMFPNYINAPSIHDVDGITYI